MNTKRSYNSFMYFLLYNENFQRYTYCGNTVRNNTISVLKKLQCEPSFFGKYKSYFTAKQTGAVQ